MLYFFNKIKQFCGLHERAVSAGALLWGFLVDSFTLQRIDLLFENIVLSTYLIVSGLAILYINLYEANKVHGKVADWFGTMTPIFLQFVLGGLYSGFFIFYFRSATIGTSWPFLVLLMGILVGNELYTRKMKKIPLQVGLFFISLLSFLIFFVPVFMKKMGASVFVLSGMVSVVLIVFFIKILRWINKEKYQQQSKGIFAIIVGIFVGINILYFSNIIPPIPLSLKEIKIAYHVERLGNTYHIDVAQRPWFMKLIPSQDFLVQKNKPVYVYSSIFAPTQLQTDVVHEWQFLNAEEKWETVNSILFPITGGRGGGYRGYTYASRLQEGKWRIHIKTKRGQVIGRKVFIVKHVDQPPKVKEIIH